jgi:pyruvate dehydrogenase E2 component (dihydrolipoamide acetyltransferase)
MPALGIAQDTGVLLNWLKKEGEQVTKGEPLIEIETDKATVEVEATASGTLANITAAPGDEVPVGQVIAWILAPGEEAGDEDTTRSGRGGEVESASSPPRHPASSPVAARMAAEHNIDLSNIKPQGGRVQKADVLTYLEARADGGQRPALRPSKGGVSNGSTVSGRQPASPKARRLARERGLDLNAIAGSGPEGAVLAQDVLDFEVSEVAAPVSVVEPAAAHTLAVSATWRVMAERVTQSWTSVPHFYLIREVEASRLMAWRTVAQNTAEEKITYTDLLVKVVAAGLRQFPRLNAAWNEGMIRLNEEINIGLAVATAEGLVVPVIHRADTLTLAELAQRRQDLANRANEGKLKLADLQGGTFTLSNLGMYGVDAFNAIVNPPQAAILAVGRIADRVVPVDGQPAVRPMMVVSLSCDHRVVDGARAAQFMDTLTRLIEEPLGLIN